MKTKKQFTNRILSLVLVLVMVVSMLPMTAYAATEVNDLVYNYDSLIEYTDGTTQYVKHNNYLYKVTYTNLQPEEFTNVALGRSSYNFVQLFMTTSIYISLYKNHDSSDKVETSDLPKSEGISLSCYDFYGYDNAVNQKQPIVIITCIAVNEPTWSWTGTSSATATFTAKDADVFATAEASISSETISAAINCQTKEQIQYTATVTFNGQKYTDTKTVDGEAGPHSYTYTADGFVLTEKCANGCGHQAIADIVAGEAIYTGSAITNTATISYTAGTWAGDKPVLSFENNVKAGTATAKMTAGGVTASTTFKINPANISYATVTLDPKNGTYNGSAHTPSTTVTFNGATLVEDKDYTLSWDSSNLTNAGSHTATITGKGNFEGTKNAVFSINPADIKGAVVTLDQNTFVYDGQPHKPTASVTFNGDTLTEGVDYELYYLSSDQIMKWENGEPVKFFGTGKENCDSINAGQYYAIVFGKGNFAANSRFAYATYTIKQAKNAWVTEPSISGWTYGEAANAPTAEAKFGTVYVLYDGTANDGTTYDSDTPPTKAGSYVARFFVDEAANYEPIGDGVEFIIAKADQAAPTDLTKTDTTYFGKADGKISGLTSAMEFRKEGDSSYTAGFNGTLEYLAAGTYYVRYQGDANHNPSPDAVVTVNAGRKLQIVVPQNQVGYTVTVNKTEMEYEGSYMLKVEIHEGYTATEDFKIIISNWECGQQAGVEETYMNAIADQIIEVRGVADITPPAAEIKVKENKWTSFWNNLTFGLFFKETQDVTITTTDKGSGVKSIQYYLFDRELERDEVRSITDWIDYNGTFKINPDNRYVIYVKVTDNAGNVEYINSEGIVLDATAPVLYGIENGGVYHGDKVFKATDDYLKILKVDGVDVMAELNGDNEYKIIADNAEHTVTAIDEAGNVTEYKITVYKNYTVTYKADGEPISTETVGHGKDANLPAVPAKNGYIGKWDSDGKNITGDTTITVVYTEIPVVKPNEVKPEDKTDLEDTKKQLEDMLKDDSYTDEDKKNIQDAIDDIDDALEVIGNVEEVEETISKLPAVDTVKPDDEETIKAITDAQTAYDALSDYEKSLVDEAAKANLDKLVAALVAYDILEGDDSSWTEDSDHSITFVVNGLFSKFVGIKVDGKDVDKANYEVKAGSTIITLKASYLDTLAVGEHTITVVYTDGSTDGTFNVHAKANSPATGDNSNMFLWIALLFISGGAVITLAVVDRKKRMASNR